MSSKLKVAGYCRVSTDKADQANSLESQRNYFTQYINQNDQWQMVEVYYDEGISGTSVKKRNGFNRMIQDARQGSIDLILTKEVSRFARNTVDTLSYTRELLANHVGVIFINDNIDTRDADGELRLTIMASIAQEESRKTSERVKWGQKRRMEQGVVFGRSMLGYTVKHGKMELVPQEAETVKLIFHKYLNEEKGTHVIARELREAGFKPKRVKEWSNTVILRILRNEKYVGDLCQKKTYTPNYLSHSKKYNRGNESQIYLKDHHEPIIDRETWEKTQQELQRRSPTNEQKSKHSNRYWCSGKLVCGKCGQRFVSRTKKLKNKTEYKAWRCYASAIHGTAKEDKQGNLIGCDNTSINEKVLLTCTAFVLRHVQANAESIINEMVQEIRAVQGTERIVDISLLFQKIDAINTKKASTIDLMLEGTISREELKKQKDYYDDEIAVIAAQIEEAQNANRIYRMQTDQMQKYSDEIRRMLELDCDNELLYREMLDKIEIYHNHYLVVYLKCIPFGVKLHYQTRGRLDRFAVQIDEMFILNSYAI